VRQSEFQFFDERGEGTGLKRWSRIGDRETNTQILGWKGIARSLRLAVHPRADCIQLIGRSLNWVG